MENHNHKFVCVCFLRIVHKIIQTAVLTFTPCLARGVCHEFVFCSYPIWNWRAALNFVRDDLFVCSR